MTRPQRGFTLLELIVVIGIFGVFAAMAYGGLDRVLTARKHIEESLARTEAYQRAYQRIRADFESASPRAVRDGDGNPAYLFVYEGYYKRIEFTRGGWANLLNLPRPSLQRVGYFLDDSKVENKKLMRRSWPVLDRAPQTLPVDTPLLDHVDGLSWRFMDYNRAWSDTWPTSASSATTNSKSTNPLTGTAGSSTGPAVANQNRAGAPPLAVEMTLKTQDWGSLRLLFRFGPDSLTAAASSPAALSGPTAPATDGAPPPDDGSGDTGKGGGTSGGTADGGTTGDSSGDTPKDPP